MRFKLDMKTSILINSIDIIASIILIDDYSSIWQWCERIDLNKLTKAIKVFSSE